MGLLGLAKTWKVDLAEDEKHDAQANSTEELDAYMQIATIVKQDMIDIDHMVVGMKKDLANNEAVLQQHVDNMKPFLKAAKRQFKADRKLIRTRFKACKKQIRKNKKTWKTTWQCVPFAPHFSSLLEVQGVDEVQIKGDHDEQGRGGKGGRARRKARRAERRAKRAKKKAVRRQKIAKKKAVMKAKIAKKKAVIKAKVAKKKAVIKAKVAKKKTAIKEKMAKRKEAIKEKMAKRKEARKAKVAKMKEKLAKKKAELKAKLAKKKAELKAKLAKKKAAIKKKIAEKKASIKAKVAKAKAKIKAKRAEWCSKKPKCLLRQAKRRAKRAAKEDFKKIRKTVRDYKKQLRKARFQKQILPRVVLLLKPDLLEALKSVDMGDDSSGQVRTCEQALTEDERTDCVPIAEITVVSLLKNYLNVQLNGVLGEHLGTLFEKINEGIWKIFDPLVSAVKNSLIGTIGSIPFVGGALAAAVGLLCDILYGVIKDAVENALDNVRAILQNTIVKAIVKAVFATGLFTPDVMQDKAQKAKLGSALEKAGNDAAKEPTSRTQKEITDEAAKGQDAAQKDAKGAKAEIKAEGDVVSEAESEDDNEDKKMMEAESAEDIAEDEE